MKNTNYVFVTYRTKATAYDAYGMPVPENIVKRGTKAIRAYLEKNHTENGNFLEHITVADRYIDPAEDAIWFEP